MCGYEAESTVELFPEKESKTTTKVERAPSKPNEVPSNQTKVLGEGISSISLKIYQTALASTSSVDPNDVANTVDVHENFADEMQPNVSKRGQFKETYLKEFYIVVSQRTYKGN